MPQLNDIVINIVGQGAGAVQQMFDSIQSAASGLQGTLQNMGDKLSSFNGTFRTLNYVAQSGRNLMHLGEGFGSIAEGAVEAAANMQKEEQSLADLLHSHEKAKQVLDSVRTESNKSMFKFEDLTEASRRLTTLGMDAQKWLPTIDDLAAGTHQKVEALAQIFGRLHQGTNLGRVFMRLGQLGISREDLEKFGLQGKFTKGNKYTGTVEEAEQAVQLAVKAKFGGMSENLANNTLEGAENKFHNAVLNLNIALGQVLLPSVTKAITFVTGLANSINEFAKHHPTVMKVAAWGLVIGAVLFTLIGGFLMLGAMVGHTILGLSMLTEVIGTVGTASTVAATGGISAVVTGFIGLLPVLGLVAAGIVIIGFAAYTAKKYWDELQKPIQTADHTLDKNRSDEIQKNLDAVNNDPHSTTAQKMKALRDARDNFYESHDYDRATVAANEYSRLRHRSPEGEKVAQQLATERKNSDRKATAQAGPATTDNAGNTTVNFKPIVIPPSTVTQDSRAYGY